MEAFSDGGCVTVLENLSAWRSVAALAEFAKVAERGQ